MKMNKLDLVKIIAANVDLGDKKGTQKDAEAYLDTFIDTVVTALCQGEKVQIIGFGSFEAVERKEREGRNPQTGETLIIGATKAPKFKPGKKFKDTIANS